MSLLDDLRTLGASLVPHELPTSQELDRVVAGLVKVVEHEGVKVSEELLPKQEEQELAPIAAAAAPAATGELERVLESFARRIEGQIGELRDRVSHVESSSTAASPAADGNSGSGSPSPDPDAPPKPQWGPEASS